MATEEGRVGRVCKREVMIVEVQRRKRGCALVHIKQDETSRDSSAHPGRASRSAICLAPGACKGKPDRFSLRTLEVPLNTGSRILAIADPVNSKGLANWPGAGLPSFKFDRSSFVMQALGVEMIFLSQMAFGSRHEHAL